MLLNVADAELPSRASALPAFENDGVPELLADAARTVVLRGLGFRPYSAIRWWVVVGLAHSDIVPAPMLSRLCPSNMNWTPPLATLASHPEPDRVPPMTSAFLLPRLQIGDGSVKLNRYTPGVKTTVHAPLVRLVSAAALWYVPGSSVTVPPEQLAGGVRTVATGAGGS